MHDAGALKPGLGDGALHGQVVLMCIDTQVVGVLLGKGKHRRRDTMRGTVRRHTVQHGIRSVAAPLTVLNDVIALVRPRQKGKCRQHAAVDFEHIAATGGDIGGQLLGRRCAYRPLRGVAMRAHKGAGRVIDSHDNGNVGIEGFSDHHAATSRLLVSL